MFQISFLNTGILIFAIATVLPLIIWLLAKKKPPRIVFSSLRFIKLSEQQKKNRTKLNNILLLIIRMLIILLVVLSAARPLLKSTLLKPAKTHSPTAIAIMLDTNFQMDYLVDSQSWLDKAKAALREINKLAKPNDRLILITSDAAWNSLNAQIYAGAIPEDLISAIAVSYNTITMDEMLSMAESKLSETQMPHRELYLIGNMRAINLETKPQQRINFIPLNNDFSYENLSCHDAKPVPQLVERSRTQRIQYAIHNHGANSRKDVLVKAIVGGSKVAEKFVNLKPNQILVDQISFDVLSDGWQQGYIEVLDDKLIHDNRSYFSFNYFLRPKVLLISEETSIPWVLRASLQVYSGEGASIEIRKVNSLSISAVEDYNLVIFYQAGAYSSRHRDLLASLKQRGIGYLFLVGSNISADWKSVYSGEFAAEIGAYKTDAVSIDFHNKHHFSTALFSETQLRKVNTSHFHSAVLTGLGNGLISAKGSPLALAASKSMLWLSDFTSQSNPWFSDPSFAIFAYRSFQFLGGSASETQETYVGERINADELTLPNAKVLTLPSRSMVLDTPGIFKINSAQQKTSYLAVNLDPQASRYQRADFAQDKLLHQMSPQWQKQIFQSRLGHDIWKWMLIAVLILMILEIIIVKLSEASPGKNLSPNIGGMS